jgi:serine/threonine-protein phosphatase 2A regulatory subunit B'
MHGGKGYKSSKNRTAGKSGKSKNMKELFLKKLQTCMKIYDYKDESKDVRGKSERLSAINELQNLLQDQKSVVQLIIPNLDNVMQMIERNIFRPLPNVKKSNLAFSETGIEQEEEVDPSWPHIQGIYEFFLQLIINEAADVKSLKVYVTPQFVQMFLELFDSEEGVERDYLKNILHKLYAKLVPRRKMIRKAINECFFALIHENHKFNGAAELLDILASIISGFAVPLRDEHIIFFKNVIIPLHKVQTCSEFFEQLLRCSMLFLTKDRNLAIPLLEGLLKYWPFANCVKETLFLTELQEVLEVCEVEKIEHLIPRLFRRIVRCIGGTHLQVADRAMCFFENDYFLTILKAYKDQTFPMLVPTIVRLADNHWHKILQESLVALKTILKEIDSFAFDEALKTDSKKNKKFSIKQSDEERSAMDKKWDKLERNIKATNSDYKPPVVPFCSKNLIMDYNPLYKKVYDKEKFINQ